MSQKVAIVTDSTSYIPEELVKQYGIRVAPQVLIWGEETFRDGIDIQPDEFYARLAKAKVMPTTSQATIKTFLTMFTELLDSGYEVLAVLLSEQLSGTLDSARQAKAEFPDSAPIELFDSRTTAMAMGFLVLQAAQAAQEGCSLAECRALVEQGKDKVGVMFAVETLDFLQRGGRIGRAAHLLGTALNLKPILEVTDGQVTAVERVRTRKKSLARLVEIVEERVGDRRPVRLATLHANAQEAAREILELADGHLDADQKIFSQVSPVVGTHTGPGTVGLAWMAGM